MRGMTEEPSRSEVFVYNRNDEDDRGFAAELVERLTTAGYRVATRAAFAEGKLVVDELRRSMATSRASIVVVGSAIDAADDLAQAAAIDAGIGAGQRVAAVVCAMLTGLPKEVGRAECFNFASGFGPQSPLDKLLAWLGPPR